MYRLFECGEYQYEQSNLQTNVTQIAIAMCLRDLQNLFFFFQLRIAIYNYTVNILNILKRRKKHVSYWIYKTLDNS